MRSLFLGRFWTKIQSDNCFETVSTPGLLLEGWHCSSSNFVYNFSKTPWFPLMWMVRFVTFVHKYLWHGTNPCEQKWQIWPSTSTGTMVFCWSCKQSWSWSNAKTNLRFLVLIRSRSSNRILYIPVNGQEISISVFGRTRRTRLYKKRKKLWRRKRRAAKSCQLRRLYGHAWFYQIILRDKNNFSTLLFPFLAPHPHPARHQELPT